MVVGWDGCFGRVAGMALAWVAMEAIHRSRGVGVLRRAGMHTQAGLAGIRHLEVREVVGTLGGGAGGICQDNKGRRLGRLLGECVVKDQAIHARLPRGNVVGPHGYLVRLALSKPFY